MQIDDAVMWESYMKLLKHAFKDEEVSIIKNMLSTNNEENKLAYQNLLTLSEARRFITAFALKKNYEAMS